MPRRAARTDENQPAIVTALRNAGHSVAITSDIGGGFPDLVVSRASDRKNFLLEVKNPDKPKADQQLTPVQCAFHASWAGQIDIVKTAEEALAIVEAV